MMKRKIPSEKEKKRRERKREREREKKRRERGRERTCILQQNEFLTGIGNSLLRNRGSCCLRLLVLFSFLFSPFLSSFFPFLHSFGGRQRRTAAKNTCITSSWKKNVFSFLKDKVWGTPYCEEWKEWMAKNDDGKDGWMEDVWPFIPPSSRPQIHPRSLTLVPLLFSLSLLKYGSLFVFCSKGMFCDQISLLVWKSCLTYKIWKWEREGERALKVGKRTLWFTSTTKASFLQEREREKDRKTRDGRWKEEGVWRETLCYETLLCLDRSLRERERLEWVTGSLIFSNPVPNIHKYKNSASDSFLSLYFLFLSLSHTTSSVNALSIFNQLTWPTDFTLSLSLSRVFSSSPSFILSISLSLSLKQTSRSETTNIRFLHYQLFSRNKRSKLRLQHHNNKPLKWSETVTKLTLHLNDSSWIQRETERERESLTMEVTMRSGIDEQFLWTWCLDVECMEWMLWCKVEKQRSKTEWKLVRKFSFIWCKGQQKSDWRKRGKGRRWKRKKTKREEGKRGGIESEVKRMGIIRQRKREGNRNWCYAKFTIVNEEDERGWEQ